MNVEVLIKECIKKVIIDSFGLEGMMFVDIGDDEFLFGDGFGLDLVDVFELMVVLEKDFGIEIDDEEFDLEVFVFVNVFDKFIYELFVGQCVS